MHFNAEAWERENYKRFNTGLDAPKEARMSIPWFFAYI
jgi:hypothetical protein